MRYIIAVRLAGGDRLEHITHVKWEDRVKRSNGQSTRAEMVVWIDDGNEVRVRVGSNESKVHVVRTNPPYLKTSPNDTTADNLLSLPRF